MSTSCYVCELPGGIQCKECGSQCCDIHFELIHKDKCKVKTPEKISRV